MNFAHFMRIEREEAERSRHYVVHIRDPKFSIELTPDQDAPDRIGLGVIKRICVPNCCLGDYGKYAEFMTAAQQFFHESFSEPVEKSESRRFER